MDTPTSSTLAAADRDLRLSAYLDDELGPDDRAAVESWLRGDAAAAARLRELRTDRDALRGRLEAVLTEPVPKRLLHTVNPQPPAWRWSGWQLAAAVLLFVLGGLVGGAVAWRADAQRAAQVMARAPVLPWVQRAAVAHSVYVPEQRHPVEVKAQEDHLAVWLTRRLDVPVKLFDLRDQGFSLVGGRLLPDIKGPSAQLMYEDASGQRVTVYLRKPESSTPASFRYDQQGDLGLFYWVDGTVGYALAGKLPRERLLALAQSIYAQR